MAGRKPSIPGRALKLAIKRRSLHMAVEGNLQRNQKRTFNWGRLMRRLPALLFLIMAASVSLFPLYWLFNTSLMPANAIFKIPPDLFPTAPTLENFREVFRASGRSSFSLSRVTVELPRFYVWFLVTVAFTLLSTAIHVLFDSMAAYAFAKHRFPGDKILFGMVVAALMVPGQVTLVPQYLLVSSMGFVNTFTGLLMPGLADVIGIFLLRQFMLTIPNDLTEAAKIDGASEWRIYTRIILPLSAPALAATAIFAFQRYWNAFLWPLVVAHNPDLFTMQVGLSFIQTSEFGTNYGLLMAGAVLSALPMMVVFFAFQKYFIQGLRVGGVKG